MVVTAIFVLLSAVVLANNSRFGNIIVLQNLAHDMALSIREAQTYGIAVRRYSTGQYNVGYGMHFAGGTGYQLFADVNTNGMWDPGEEISTVSIAGGYQISDMCAPPPGSCGLSRIDILYKRPEPDACIGKNGVASVSGGACISTITRGTIVVMSPRGDTATIVIEKSGQISVQ
ncbi:MAG: hypothetical protein AAB908_00265 [Patescibacteria group bacterium]